MPGGRVAHAGHNNAGKVGGAGGGGGGGAAGGAGAFVDSLAAKTGRRLLATHHAHQRRL